MADKKNICGNCGTQMHVERTECPVCMVAWDSKKVIGDLLIFYKKESSQDKWIMVCSRCGIVMGRTDARDGFDIYDMSWICPATNCAQLWLSSDGWERVGSLFVPFGNNELRA